MNTKTWQEEKINHTAEHIGIISRGVLETLVREVIAQTREETIMEVEEMIKKEFPHQKLYCEAQDLEMDILEELNKLKK